MCDLWPSQQVLGTSGHFYGLKLLLCIMQKDKLSCSRTKHNSAGQILTSDFDSSGCKNFMIPSTFSFLNQNICSGYSKEASKSDGSFELNWRTCAEPESLSEGVQHWQSFFRFFLVEEIERIEMPLKVGNQWPASQTPFHRWHADNGPPLNAGLVALWFLGDPDQYCLETLYFCYFSGRGGGGFGPTVPPLWICRWRDLQMKDKKIFTILHSRFA